MIRSLLDTGAFEMHTMFHALKPLDSAPQSDRLKIAPQPSRGTPERTSLEPGATGACGSNACAISPQQTITSAIGQEPRTGINIIRLSNGTTVQAMVILDGAGQYEATELEYDLGRPMRCAASPMAALLELRDWLEDEIQADARRRDREFRQAVAKAAP